MHNFVRSDERSFNKHTMTIFQRLAEGLEQTEGSVIASSLPRAKSQ